jgi:tRNA-dihydrouridine synthase B
VLKDLPSGSGGILAEILNRPLRIGSKSISTRLVFAPMTYVGNLAQRAVVDHYGKCGLFFSEMCSAGRIPHERGGTSSLYRWRDEEHNRLVVQILGNDKHKMVEAAKIIESDGLFGVDINMGCSTRAICAKNCGANLLKDPDSALGIVDAIRKAVRFPVTVKFRIGWNDGPEESVQLAKRFESAGVDALTFHPRVAPDRRSRPPKWDYIRLIKTSVSIPVFGNGNVFSPEDCLRMIESTGCDGVAVGRMSIAKPWLFSSWLSGRSPVDCVYSESIHMLIELLERYFAPPQALRRIRRTAEYFCTNFHFGHALYKRLLSAKDISTVRDVVGKFFERPIDLVQYPNLNLFC